MSKYSKPPEYKRIFYKGVCIGTITYGKQLPINEDGTIDITEEVDEWLYEDKIHNDQ
jgi:hypothetical protein